MSATARGSAMSQEEWLDSIFDDEGIERFKQAFEQPCGQDQVDLDYNGGVPPYEENI